jgi:mannosyl-3-phosphoglycerate synthase
MRIDVQRYTERFGSVRLNDVQRVLELDSGRVSANDSGIDIAMINISDDVSRDIEEKMAIAIMVKDEKLKLFEGVVSGVPHDCLIIVVSNSKRKRVDRFRMERDALFQFSRFTRRKAMIIHQKDPVLAQALGDAGYGSLLDEDGLLRSGKCEGMIAAMLLAKLAKKDYIGFVDADNYFPGAIWEYAKVYAAGFSIATSPYAMVRILWRYKPKMSEGMHFRKYGRVSEISNKYMNNVISTATGFETDIIKTSNAGEHAMSLRLAEILPYAAGYAVEPQELLSIFEGFGGVMPIAQPTAAKHGVEILQIETRNPHLHEEKGSRHIYQEMLLPSLSAIYHSPLCFDTTRESIAKEMVGMGVIKEGEEPPRPRLYEAPHSIDFRKFREAMAEHPEYYSAQAPGPERD